MELKSSDLWGKFLPTASSSQPGFFLNPMYMGVFPEYICTTCIFGTHGDQKKWDPLKLDLTGSLLDRQVSASS